MNNSSSNGYMIRLEVLKMAQSMAEQEWHSQRDLVNQDYINKVEAAKSAPGSIELPPLPTLNPFPTPELIKSKANELYQFVLTKE
jgi:hypothetical protein